MVVSLFFVPKCRLPTCQSVDFYATASSCELIAALGATKVTVHTASGEFVCEHPRAYGKAPTDTSDPASQLAVLAGLFRERGEHRALTRLQ